MTGVCLHRFVLLPSEFLLEHNTMHPKSTSLAVLLPSEFLLEHNFCKKLNYLKLILLPSEFF